MMTTDVDVDPMGWGQGARLFLSADLTSSTKFKTEKGLGWVKLFREFFMSFVLDLRDRHESELRKRGLEEFSRLRVWKLAGDEVLLHTPRLPDASYLAVTTQAFVSAVADADAKWHDVGMGVKGTAWLAGFPIRNVAYRVNPYAQTILRPVDSFHGEGGEEELEETNYGAGIAYEFLGPEIDLGFRLARVARPGRVVLDVQIPLYITSHDVLVRSTSLFHVGWHYPKGIFETVPYPVIWAVPETSVGTSRSLRYAEHANDELVRALVEGDPLEAKAIEELALAYVEATDNRRVYLHSDDAPDDDHDLWIKRHAFKQEVPR